MCKTKLIEIRSLVLDTSSMIFFSFDLPSFIFPVCFMAVVITLVLSFQRYLRIYKTADYTQGGVISAYDLVRISLHPLEIQFLKCTINYDTCKFVKVTSIHKEELFKEI